MIDLTPIFCVCDDFCKLFSEYFAKHVIGDGTDISLNPSPRFSSAELMTILIAFHLSGFHDLKHFYVFVQSSWKGAFPGLPSYNRFVELIPSAAIFLFAMQVAMRGDCTNLARRGKSTMGWFYGFKLHLVINNLGHIIAFTLTEGNTDDRKPVPQLLHNLFGKIFGDKGYISKDLFNVLLGKGLKLVTAHKSNMKPAIATLEDSDMLSRRSIIESVFNVLKNSCRIEHSRHRSPRNFAVNILAALCAYMMRFILGVTGEAVLQEAA